MNVVSIGELVVDWLSLTPAEDFYSATTFHRALGGNSTNVAIGLQRLGTAVSLIGKIGKDMHGQFLKQALTTEGVSLEYVIVDERYPTMQCYMTTTADGEHEYHSWPHPHAAGMLQAEDLPIDRLKSAGIVHSTAVSMAVDPRCSAIERAVTTVIAAGGLACFDASHVAGIEARSRAEKLMSSVHILKMNLSELYHWAAVSTDTPLDETIGLVWKRYSPVALFVTQASHGSIVITNQGKLACPSLKVNALSEVGAGDAFIAGVLHMLCRHLDQKKGNLVEQLQALDESVWRRTAMAGNIAGALTTLENNAYAGMPDQEALMERLKSLV